MAVVYFKIWILQEIVWKTEQCKLLHVMAIIVKRQINVNEANSNLCTFCEYFWILFNLFNQSLEGKDEHRE